MLIAFDKPQMDHNCDMDRLGSLDPQRLSGSSRQLYDDTVEYFDANLNYIYKFPDNGRMVGPFGLELHTPGPGYAWLNMTKSLAQYKSLDPLAREVAILVTASHEQAVYAMYAHSAVSGLPKAELDQIIVNKVCPPRLDAQCQIAFKMATELCVTPGPLKEDVWQEGLEVLGREAAIAIVHYCGFYKYVATILNGFDARLPAPKQW